MIVKSSKFKVKSYNSKFKVIKLLVNFGLLTATLHFALCTLHLSKANAQSLSLSLWPPLLEVMVQPGKTVTQVYKLTNNSDRELQITPQVFPFEPVGDKGQIKILVPNNKATKPQSSFFSFENAEFDQAFPIAIGQTKELVLKISIPKDTPQKDSYFTLLFSSSELPQSDQSESSSVAQIGSNILLTVSRTGLPSPSGKILEFSVPKIIDSFSPVNFKLVLQNDGSSFWKPFGEIKISGMLKQNEKLPLLEQNVLGNSFRQMTIAPFRSRLAIGQFKADLKFSLNEDGQSLSQTVFFWYLPYKLLIALVSLLVIFILFKKIFRKILHH